MKTLISYPLLILGLIFSTANLSAQIVITTADGNGADTFLTNDENDGPDTVHGTEPDLNLRGLDGVRARTILLRFDTNTLADPDFTGATLSLNLISSTRARDWTVYGLTDETLANWDEATTSYSNAPGILAADPGITSIDNTVWTELGTWNIQQATGIQTSDPVSLNLTDYLNNSPGGLASFLLYFNSGDSNPDWFVTSHEGADATSIAPSLNVIPEPSTYAIIFGAIALLGTAARRRIRKG